MPHIEIIGPDHVDHPIAQVLRDDQIITWKLARGLAWDPKMKDTAVEFLPKDDFYSKFPGGTPEAVGPEPAPGTPDRRDYRVDTNKKMADRKFELYHYRVAVIDLTTGKRIMVRVKHGKKRPWYDPDVVNEPRP